MADGEDLQNLKYLHGPNTSFIYVTLKMSVLPKLVFNLHICSDGLSRFPFLKMYRTGSLRSDDAR